VIEHDKNYTSSVVSMLFHNTEGGEAGAYFQFWPIEGEPIIRRGRLFEETLIGGFTYLNFGQYASERFSDSRQTVSRAENTTWKTGR